MTQVTLHPAPRWRDVVLEQIRIVGLSLRREALVVAVVVSIVTLVIGVDIIRGEADSWFDSDEWFQIAVVSLLVPFVIWRRDRRFAPAFLWTLPVDRRRLALAKVFGGWVWLMIGLATLFLWQLALAALSRVPEAETAPFIAFSGATAAYLFGSALVLGLRHPLRWLLGAAGLFFLLGFLNNAMERMPDGPLAALISSSHSYSMLNRAATAWLSLPAFARWAIATVVSVGAGLITLLAAASRHKENR